jgi:hypothetical protein
MGLPVLWTGAGSLRRGGLTAVPDIPGLDDLVIKSYASHYSAEDQAWVGKAGRPPVTGLVI